MAAARANLVRRLGRLPLMAMAMLTLLVALWAGLVRLGWALPPLRPSWIVDHGSLMISGFLGTLISLERAVALSAVLKARWPYAAPALAGLGSLAIVVGAPALLGRGLILLGSLGLVVIFAAIVRLRPDAAHAVMGLGALLWLAGNGWWASGQPIYRAVPWWAGFLVLTIAGERLELAGVLLRHRSPRVLFLFSVGLLLAGLPLSVFAAGAGLRLSGAGLVALGLWSLRYDIARRTIRQAGLTRFIAACLLAGYVWLALAGALWMAWADRFVAGPLYDAMLHSLLLGYVFSMIFGHAPIILPAVLNLPIIYRPAFYLHLALLHASLIVRVAGDLTITSPLRMWGGLLNVIAVLLFLGNLARSVRRNPEPPPAPGPAGVGSDDTSIENS